MILIRATAPALADLKIHGSCYYIPTSQVFSCRGIPLHEAFAVRIEEISALPASTFRDEHPGAMDPRRVELHELHILVRKTRAGNHGITISGRSMCRRAGEVSPAVTARREDSVSRKKAMQRAVFKREADDPNAGTVDHEKIKGEEFHEELGIVLEFKHIRQSVSLCQSTILNQGSSFLQYIMMA